MVFEIDAMREGHHPREDSTAKMSIEDRVLLLLANQRPRMKTMVLYSNVILNPIKVLNVLLDVLGLIVKHHSDDIETRVLVRILKVPGFIYKDAQRLFHHQKERGGNLFPPLPRGLSLASR